MSKNKNKAMSVTSLDLLFVIIPFIIVSSISCSVEAAFITPILKDQKTLQYTTTINLQTPLRPTKLVIDLGAQFSWVNCQSGYNSTTYAHTPCNSTLCTALNSFACSNCYTPPAPDCGNFTCALFPENPISNNASIDDAVIDRLSVLTTSGSQSLIPNFVFSCSKTYMLTDLAQNSTGMLALGRANFSFPPQLARHATLPNIFSLCLSPSTTLPGFALFASQAPSELILDRNNLSKTLTLTLTYTPLVLNPFSDTIITYALHPSFNYFINLTSISINNINLNINKTLLSIDPNTGLGGTKISTVEPYTVLEPSIYTTFVTAFESAAASMNLTPASPIKPFKVCYYANSTTETASGSPNVPTIELGFGDGVKWSVIGANSMVSVKTGKSRRWCLGVVEKGVVATERAAVVVGGLMVEDNVVEFDLVRLRFGFSGNLGVKGTSCAAAAATTFNQL